MEQQLNSSTGGWIGDDRRDEDDFKQLTQTDAKPIVSGSCRIIIKLKIKNMSDLTKKIKQQQILLGEEMVIANLKAKGLIPNEIKKDDKIINHIRNVKLLQAIHSGKKFFVECYPTDEGAICFPNSNRAVKEIELPEFDLYEEKLGYKWVKA